MLSVILPRPVPVDLGDPPQRFLAMPLRVRDLADFEAVAVAAWPHPSDLVPGEDVDTPERRRLLADALDAAEAGPPRWGQGCPLPSDGMLAAALRLHKLDADDLAALCGTITPDQWTRLSRVAFGVDPATELVARIDRLMGCPIVRGGSMPWAEAVASACEAFGYTPEQVGEMTLPALSCLLGGGKRPDPWHFDDEHASPEDSEAYHGEVQPRRAAFFDSVRPAAVDEAGQPDAPAVGDQPEHGDEPGAGDVIAVDQ